MTKRGGRCCDISKDINIYEALLSLFPFANTKKRDTWYYSREASAPASRVCVRYAYTHSYARVHAETKPRTLFYEWVHRGERDKAKGRKLPSNSVCVTCVSDFYLPLTTAILHTRLCLPFSSSLIFFHPFIFSCFFKHKILNPLLWICLQIL